ncbi:MAG: EsaB/YukD family protein [Peptococcaceae bacterium]|nr:EsaB/YukD family protein [Peptococcaceae bacterium]
MENKTAVVIFRIHKRNYSTDVEVPLHITANDLFLALSKAYDLPVDTSNILNCYLKAENPVALLKGSKTLGEYGIRTGSVIHFTE